MTSTVRDRVRKISRRESPRKRSHPRVFIDSAPIPESYQDRFKEGWVSRGNKKILARFKLSGFLFLRWWSLVEVEHDF